MRGSASRMEVGAKELKAEGSKQKEMQLENGALRRLEDEKMGS